MRPIAKRGSTVAWVTDPFDPNTDDVELRVQGRAPMKVMWQRALKFGYWEPVGDAD
jgi:hypothetical protein